MLQIPKNIIHLYDTCLERDRIATKLHVHYKKWLRYYLDFCHKYNFKPADKKSFPSFNDKLKAKNQPELFRKQAYHAVCLYYSIIAPMKDNPTATSSISNSIKEGNSEVFVPAAEQGCHHRSRNQPKSSFINQPERSKGAPMRLVLFKKTHKSLSSFQEKNLGSADHQIDSLIINLSNFILRTLFQDRRIIALSF